MFSLFCQNVCQTGWQTQVWQTEAVIMLNFPPHPVCEPSKTFHAFIFSQSCLSILLLFLWGPKIIYKIINVILLWGVILQDVPFSSKILLSKWWVKKREKERTFKVPLWIPKPKGIGEMDIAWPWYLTLMTSLINGKLNWISTFSTHCLSDGFLLRLNHFLPWPYITLLLLNAPHPSVYFDTSVSPFVTG